MSSVETCASVHAAKARPTDVGDPSMPRMPKATAIGARFVPKNEIVLAENSKRKLRSPSAPVI